MQKGPGIGVEPVGLLPPVRVHHLGNDVLGWDNRRFTHRGPPYLRPYRTSPKGRGMSANSRYGAFGEWGVVEADPVFCASMLLPLCLSSGNPLHIVASS